MRSWYIHLIHLQMVMTLLWTTYAMLVGSIYLAASLCYGISGLLMSWIMRGELGGLGEQLLFGDHQLYNTLTTSQRAYWRVYLPPLTVVCGTPVAQQDMRVRHSTCTGGVTTAAATMLCGISRYCECL